MTEKDTGTAKADSGVEAVPDTYRIEPVDTLGGIAWRYGLSLNSLLKVNNMRLTQIIYPGMIITLKGVSAAASSSPDDQVSRPATPQGGSTSTVSSGKVKVTRSGESKVFEKGNPTTAVKVVKIPATSIIQKVVPGGSVGGDIERPVKKYRGKLSGRYVVKDSRVGERSVPSSPSGESAYSDREITSNVTVDPIQAAAARLRLVTDKRLGRESPAWVKALAELDK